MKRVSFMVIFLAAITLTVSAQNENDALRFSMISPGGTARFVSTGGAFGALGGDFSSLSTNPAGIAVYRRNEFTLTPVINYSRVNSTFLGNQEEDMKYNFSLNNIGLVFTMNDPNTLKESGWMGVQFGFGLNNLMNFSNRRIYEGFNTQNSLMSVFLDKANAETNFNSNSPESYLDDYTTGLAWDTWLLGLDTLANTYFIDMPNNVMQRRETNTSGSIKEMNFTFGANYSNRLYLGASVGVPFLRFEEDYTFTEVNSENLDTELNSLEYSENLSVTGVGFNFKLGAILRATDMIRLGAAVHTPTFYTIEDDWSTAMKSDLWSYGRLEAESPNAVYEYQLNTPMKAIGSLGLVFGTGGLLSAEYEYVDYTQMRFRSEDDPYTAENDRIQTNFQAQHNLRFGGEIKLNPLVLRAGYALYSNPLNLPEVSPLEKTTMSAGIGIREQNFYIDFAYYLTNYTEDFFQYYNFNKSRGDAVSYDYNNQGFMMTLGFRF